MKDYDNYTDDLLNENEEKAGWMTTFADLMTLLLVFFVLLYSISSRNLESYTIAMNSIRSFIGDGTLSIGLTKLLKVTDILDTHRSIEDLTGLKSTEDKIYEELEQFIEAKHLGDNVSVEYFEGKLIIRVKGQILFKSGAAELNTNGLPILNQIANVIDEYSEYNVNIQGHTDNDPISTLRFPSNWELSAIRSTNVLRFLLKAGVAPERMTATGFGELLPLKPNISKANKALNRRVEFVLEKKAE